MNVWRKMLLQTKKEAQDSTLLNTNIMLFTI